MAKNPNQLINERKFSNPIDWKDEMTDEEDSYYWAFQDALDFYDDDELNDDVIETELNNRYTGLVGPDARDYAARKAFIHNGLNKWNEKNKVHPTPRRSDIDIWRQKVADYVKAHPDNAYVANLGFLANDPNGTDHSDIINDLILNFNRDGEW